MMKVKNKGDLLYIVRCLLFDLDGEYLSSSDFESLHGFAIDKKEDWQKIFDKYLLSTAKNKHADSVEALRSIEGNEIWEEFYEKYKNVMFLPEHWLADKENFILFARYLCNKTIEVNQA